jgi:hypothetical protein
MPALHLDGAVKSAAAQRCATGADLTAPCRRETIAAAVIACIAMRIA